MEHFPLLTWHLAGIFRLLQHKQRKEPKAYLPALYRKKLAQAIDGDFTALIKKSISKATTRQKKMGIIPPRHIQQMNLEQD